MLDLLEPTLWPRLPVALLELARLFEQLRLELSAVTGIRLCTPTRARTQTRTQTRAQTRAQTRTQRQEPRDRAHVDMAP